MRKPSLPQHDSDPDTRRKALEDARDDYQFDFSYHQIVSAKKVPLREKTDPRYWAALAKVTAELKLNELRSRSAAENAEALVEKIAEEIGSGLEKLGGPQIAERLRKHSRTESSGDRSPQSYQRMYATIDPPSIVPFWKRDDVFAWQAVAGTNPIMIRRLAEPHPRFPVTNALYQRSLPDDTLEAAMKEGRLYVADYAILAGITPGDYQGWKKTIFAPIALYAWSKAEQRLVAVAIQCTQKRGDPIFTPADGTSWRMARATVTIADGNFQGVISHFAWCHEVMESVILSTHRTLAPWHPIGVLLAPHFANTMITNDIAMTSLIGPDGNMERLQSGKLTDSLDLALGAIADFRLAKSAPHEDFAARGVDDVEALPDYPFRDDGLLSWPHIRTWARDYLRLYYTSDADVRADHEVADWVREMGSDEGGRLQGLQPPKTFDALAELLSRILFRCTVYHAAFNYTSYDFFAYAPNMQAAGFGAGPTGTDSDSELALQAMWPPYQAAYEGMHLFYTIFRVQLNRLGHYPDGHFEDERVAPLEQKLRAALDEVEKTIAARDAGRIVPYPYLMPSRVSNSIHV